jgi:hypothetical protein
MSTERRYVPPSISARELSEELDEFWKELKDPDSDARQIIEDERIEVEVDKLAELKREDVIAVHAEKAGLTGVELLVVLAPFAPVIAPVVKSASNVAEKVILDLWDVAFKRWLRGRGRGDALVEKK